MCFQIINREQHVAFRLSYQELWHIIQWYGLQTQGTSVADKVALRKFMYT